MRYLGIDYGLKRTGLAVCDESETICTPLVVLNSADNVFEKIRKIVDNEQVEAIVVGLPYNMDGSIGRQAKLTEQFGQELGNALPDKEILFQDERLSSFEAGEKLVGSDLTNKKKKKIKDAIAAAEILQSYIDCKSLGSNELE